MANHSPVKKRLQAEPDFALRAGIFIVCWIPDLFENHSNYYKTIGREWRDFHSILGKNATPRATYRQSDEAHSTENPYVAFLDFFMGNSSPTFDYLILFTKYLNLEIVAVL